MAMAIVTEMAGAPRRRAIAAAVAMLAAGCAQAAEWSFTPTLDLRETYTDNVRLQAQGKSDFVTQVTPGLGVKAKGPDLTLNANVGVQETYYGNHNAGSSLLNLGRADLKARLADNLLYLDSAASVSQQTISAFGPQPVDNTNGGDRTSTVRTTRVSPYLSHKFGQLASAELRYARESVNASSGGLASSNTDELSFKADSGPAYHLIGWGLQASDRTTHYSGQNRVALQNILGRLSYLLAPRLRLVGTLGHDSNDYSVTNQATSGYSWSGGVEWKVSQRTSLNASLGHKYYGNTYALTASTRSRMANWMLSYAEDVTTTPAQFSLPVTSDTASFLDKLLSASITDPTARAAAVANMIRQGNLPASLDSSINSFTNTVFLQKRLQASVLLSGVRTTLLLSVFDVERQPFSNNGLGSLVGSANDHTEQLGASAVLSRRLSERVRMNGSLAATRVKSLTSGRVDNTQTLRLGLTRQLTPDVQGTVELRRNQGQSTQSGVAYRENAISAFLNMKL